MVQSLTRLMPQRQLSISLQQVWVALNLSPFKLLCQLKTLRLLIYIRPSFQPILRWHNFNRVSTISRVSHQMLNL